MLEGVHVVDVQIARAIGQHVIFPDGLIKVALRELGRRPQRQHVRLQGARRIVQDVAGVEVEILRMGDDRGADVHVGAEAAGVVEVLVGVDHEPDRFVGNQLDDLFDDRQAPLFVQRRLENRDEIVELDRDAVMR